MREQNYLVGAGIELIFLMRRKINHLKIFDLGKKLCFGCQHFFVGLIAPNFKSISTQTLFDNFFEAFRDLLLFYFATKN